MDAKEYILIATRMCDTFYGKECDKCQSGSKPFCVATMNNKIAEHVDEAIELVEQWAKDHPVKTRKSEFLKMFPDANLKIITRLLPCAIDSNMNPLRCVKYGYLSITCRCDRCRDDYWNEEVSDND